MKYPLLILWVLIIGYLAFCVGGCATTEHEGIDYLGEQPWYAGKKVLDFDPIMWDNGILTIEQRK